MWIYPIFFSDMFIYGNNYIIQLITRDGIPHYINDPYIQTKVIRYGCCTMLN